MRAIRLNFQKPSKNIYGFHHICFLNNGEDIATEQINTIKESGLYDATTQIFCSIMGSIPDTFQLPSKYIIIYKSSDTKQAERKILEYMYQFSHQTSGKYWYIHTKGVTRFGTPLYKNVESWRRYMEFFVLQNWKQCSIDLEHYDVVGVNYQTDPLPHLSGNFWWSKSSYVARNPTNFNFSYNTETEMWICRQHPRVKSYHQSNVNHYLVEYPKTCYKSISYPSGSSDAIISV